MAADIPDLAAVEVNFDGITYAKGASVLKQLVAYVGLEEFLAGLRDYFRDHAFGNATFGDLLGALEKASGRDLSGWGQQWLKTTGLNTLRADFDLDADGRFTRFAVSQSGAAPGAGETRVHRLAVGVYDDDGTGKLVRVHREELDVEGEVTEVPALQGVSRGKLILVNDDDLTYCSLRLDPDSLQTVLTRIADIAEPLPRTLAWSAAWEMTREAEMKARDFVALVEAGVHAETEVGVAQRLLLQAQTALNSYADPDWACSDGWPAFADRLLELARGAEPGSDHQLAYVNALCSSALSLRHVAVLAALLDADPAEQGLSGLVVDADLRWRIVTALAASGDVDADGTEHRFIDTEAERDPTAAGQRHAAQAAAARPQAAVKDAAWQQVIEDDTLANITARSVIAGFVQPGQAELLQPFTRQVLRRHLGGVGAAFERGRADGGDRAVSVVGYQPGRPGCRRRVPGWGGPARAAAVGARGPRGCGARTARAGVRRQLARLAVSRERACLRAARRDKAAFRARSRRSSVREGTRNNGVSRGRHGRSRKAGQGGETPALSTRTALISPSIRLPCWKADAAADTPSGAADSMPRPWTSEPYTTSIARWSGETASSTALSGVGTSARISRAVAAVSSPRPPTYTAKRALAARDPYFSASSRVTRSMVGNG